MKTLQSLVVMVGLVLSANMLFPCVSHARDLQGRLGLGYNRQFGNDTVASTLPGISLKYAMTRDIAIDGIFAVSTADPGVTTAAVKFYKILFFETNLNFYTMLGAGLLSAASKSGMEFLTGFGAEFFIPGIESLGISFETGVTLDNLPGSFVLKTMGHSFLEAGIHFYF